MAKQNKIRLSDLQFAVMRVLWRHGRATTPQVAEALKKERGLAYTTTATLLKRLEKRGLVSSKSSNRMLVFTPRVSEAEVRRSMVVEMVGTLFGGDPKALVSHLVDENKIEPEDLEHLKNLLEKGRDR